MKPTHILKIGGVFRMKGTLAEITDNIGKNK